MPRVKHKSVKFSPEEMAQDVPAELNETNSIPVIGRGLYAAETRGARPLKATYAIVDDSLVTFEIDDGRRVSAPVKWYPRLANAAPRERGDWRIVLNGRAVMWKSLGIILSVKALFEGVKADESPASLKKWLDSRKPKRKAG